jgi:hypothetical protein
VCFLPPFFIFHQYYSIVVRLILFFTRRPFQLNGVAEGSVVTLTSLQEAKLATKTKRKVTKVVGTGELTIKGLTVQVRLLPHNTPQVNLHFPLGMIFVLSQLTIFNSLLLSLSLYPCFLSVHPKLCRIKSPPHSSAFLRRTPSLVPLGQRSRLGGGSACH